MTQTTTRKIAELVVTLHTNAGDVVSAFPPEKEKEFYNLVRGYSMDGYRYTCSTVYHD